MNETTNGMPVDKNIYVEVTLGWNGCDVVAALGKFDWKGAANAVRDWAERHIGYKDYQDLSWSFSALPGMVFVVDFGSHSYFARYRVEGGNDDGYGPYNCRWATRKEQMRNTSADRMVEVDGERMCLAEAAERSRADYNLVHHRIRAGWSVKRALTEGVHHG